MRAPFQIFAIPYRIVNSKMKICVLHRADIDQWQLERKYGRNVMRVMLDTNILHSAGLFEESK